MGLMWQALMNETKYSILSSKIYEKNQKMGLTTMYWRPPPQLILFLESTPFCQFFPIVHLSQVEKMHMWLTQSMSSASHVSFCHFKDVKLTKLGTTKKIIKLKESFVKSDKTRGLI